MPKGSGVLASACAAAVALSFPLVVMPPATAAPSRPPVTFIDALAAVPAATRALASARQELGLATTRRATIAIAAAAAEAERDAATSTLRETHAAAVRADVAAAQSQASLDGIARTMYMTGGTMPTLVDVMLTADSELGLSRSLVTRRYLAAAGERVVTWAGITETARQQAIGSHAAASITHDVAGSAVLAADSALAIANDDVAAARTVADDARAEYRTLMRLTKVDRSADYGRLKTCGDWLTRLLSRSGFEGEDLREAWAIVMRESGGRKDAISRTDDLGLFQINTATWKSQPWFDRELLLTKRYNATVAHTLSRGGSTWYSWGLDGHGRPDARAYVKSGWTQERIVGSIVMPYVQWYSQYPCRPAYEKNLGLGLPERPLSDEGIDRPALQEGAGVRPDEATAAFPATGVPAATD